MNIEDSYKIGIKLDVHGTAYTKFNELVKVMDKLNEKIKITTELFKRFNRTFETTSTVFKSMSSTINTAGLKINTLGNRFDRLTMKMNRATAEAHQFGVAMATQGTIGRIGGGGGGGRHRGYRHSPAGFFAHGAEMRGAARFIGAGAMGGMGGIAAMGAGYLGVHSFKEGQSLEAITQKINSQGFGNVAGGAYQHGMTSPIPGVSILEYLQAYSDALAITKNKQQAGLVTPVLAKMGFTDKAIFSRQGRKFTDLDLQALVKSAELRTGKIDAKDIINSLNTMQKGMELEGMTLSPKEMLAMFRRNASGFPLMSDSALIKSIVLAQDMGGGQLGSMLRVASSQLLRGQNFKTGKRALKRLESEGVMTRGGTVANPDLLTKDTFKWVNDFLIPSYAKIGVTKPEDIRKRLMMDFSGRIPNLFYQTYMDKHKLDEAVKVAPNTLGIQGGFTATQKTSIAAQQRASAAWESFSVALSKLTSPEIIAGLNALTSILDRFTKRLNQFSNWGANIRKNHKDVGDYLSHGLFGSHWFHNHFGNTVKTAPSSSSNSTHVTLNMDGKKVANGVINHMNKSANAPLSSGNALHTNLALIPSGLNYLSGGL
jgi:hypothetical protein